MSRQPPTVLPEQDFGWQFANVPNDPGFGRPAIVKPGSSLLGNGLIRQTKEHDLSTQEPFDQQRRNSSLSTITQGHDHAMTNESLPNMDKEANTPTPVSNTEYVLVLSRIPVMWKELESNRLAYLLRLYVRNGNLADISQT
jgi:hypothetical protein